MVTLGGATAFGIEKFELNVRNAVENVDTKEFWCPGSTLKASFANDHPLAYGMPSEGLVLFWASPVFEITPSGHNDHYEIIVRYADRDILQSGWLHGESFLHNKVGLAEVKLGKGRMVLIPIKVQHRAQPYGTFKLLFNTLIESAVRR